MKKPIKKLALSEMVYAAMAKEDEAVQQLSKMAGVSPTLFKDLMAGEKNFDLRATSPKKN